MSKMICPLCKKNVSEKVFTCPHCGAKFETKSSFQLACEFIEECTGTCPIDFLETANNKLFIKFFKMNQKARKRMMKVLDCEKRCSEMTTEGKSVEEISTECWKRFFEFKEGEQK